MEALVSPNYVTLSYRWGASKSYILATTYFEQLRHGESISDLPLTFRNAIIEAHRLSIRYLWIDYLYIIQDSMEDWERESAERDIYTNSACNISATASLDPHGSLLEHATKQIFNQE